MKQILTASVQRSEIFSENYFMCLVSVLHLAFDNKNGTFDSSIKSGLRKEKRGSFNNENS